MQLVPDVSSEVSGFANNISDLISRDTFVPQDVQDRLNGFNGTGVGGINYNTVYRAAEQSHIVIQCDTAN